MNIVLCCAVGMSTSLLLRKMEKAANEQKLDVQIMAVPIDVAAREMNDADVLLLGPQVRYLEKEMKELGRKNGVSVAVIDQTYYGTLNGEKVLELAQQLYNK